MKKLNVVKETRKELKIKSEGRQQKKEKDNLSRASIEAQTIATIGYSCSFEF